MNRPDMGSNPPTSFESTLDDPGAQLHVLRVQVLGCMSSVLYHEISNILTVVSGLRQSLAAGLGDRLEGKIGTMIDDQVTRSSELSRSFLDLWATEKTAEPSSWLQCRADVGALLRLKGRGRQVQVFEAGDDDHPIDGDRAALVRVSFAACSLTLLDRVYRYRVGAHVELRSDIHSVPSGSKEGELLMRATIKKPEGYPRGLPIPVEIAQKRARLDGASIESELDDKTLLLRGRYPIG